MLIAEWKFEPCIAAACEKFISGPAAATSGIRVFVGSAGEASDGALHIVNGMVEMTVGG